MANITVLDLDFDSITVNLPFSQGRKTITSDDSTDESASESDETLDEAATEFDDESTEFDESAPPKAAAVGIVAMLVVFVAIIALVKRRRGGDE